MERHRQAPRLSGKRRLTITSHKVALIVRDGATKQQKVKKDMTLKTKREMIEVSAFLIMAICFLIFCDETEGSLIIDVMKKIVAVLVIVTTYMTRRLLVCEIRKNKN